MSAIAQMIAIAIAFLLSLLGAALVSRIGDRLQLTDAPNHRSSHSTPKPRGGGLGVVFSVNALLFACATFIRTDVNGLFFICSGMLVSIVGLVDDVRSVSPRYRLASHIVAAMLVVLAMPAGWSIPIIGRWELIGIVGGLIGVLGIAWMINLFNFMDGIDGIAGSEAVFVAGVGSLLVLRSHPGDPLVLVLALVAAASAGFLVVNWPPSRVFMGDVGSGFLGFAIGALAFWASAMHLVSIWTWLILTGVFLLDATVTLVRRALRGEKLDAAHRMHAYQRLSRRWSSHSRVTLMTVSINVLWLLPFAVASELWPAWAALLCFVALAPIAIGVWRVGAGLPD